MIRYFFVSLLSICIAEGTMGQRASDSTRSKYIEQFDDKFFVWPFVYKRSLSFEMGNRNTGEKINYKPNSTFSAGLGIYIFEVAAEISFTLPANERNQSTYGHTDAREFHASFLGNGGGMDVFRQRYKGFYFPVRSGLSKQSVVKRPDIELINTGVNGIYVFNKNRFSLMSAYNFSERQLKSGGSFILTGNLNTFRLNADSVILGQQTDPLNSSSDFQLMRYTTLSLAGGYTYTFVYRSFFLNGAFSIGPAHNWILYQRPGEQEHYDVAINTFNDIRVSLGYNSDRLFCGISLVAQSRYIRFENIQFANTSTVTELVVGYRFNEIGVLKKRAKDYIPRKPL